MSGTKKIVVSRRVPMENGTVQTLYAEGELCSWTESARDAYRFDNANSAQSWAMAHNFSDSASDVASWEEVEV